MSGQNISGNSSMIIGIKTTLSFASVFYHQFQFVKISMENIAHVAALYLAKSTIFMKSLIRLQMTFGQGILQSDTTLIRSIQLKK